MLRHLISLQYLLNKVFVTFFQDWPWWAIFTPLWIWKTIAALGATVGAIVWCRYPHYRLNSFGLQLYLFLLL